MPVWSLLASCLRRAGLLHRQTRRRGQRTLRHRTFRPVLELLEARLPPGQLFGNLGVTPTGMASGDFLSDASTLVPETDAPTIVLPPTKDVLVGNAGDAGVLPVLVLNPILVLPPAQGGAVQAAPVGGIGLATQQGIGQPAG